MRGREGIELVQQANRFLTKFLRALKLYLEYKFGYYRND